MNDLHCPHMPASTKYLNQKSEVCAGRHEQAQTTFVAELFHCKSCRAYLIRAAEKLGVFL